MFRYTLSRRTDLLIGGLDNDERVNKLLGKTKSYIQDDQTWCVQAAQAYDTWENIFSLFTPEMWFILTFVAILLAIILHLLLKFRRDASLNVDFSHTWLITFASFLNMPAATFKARGPAINIIFIFACAYGIVFSAVFSCSLISILTRPRLEFQVNSIHAAYKGGYRFVSGNVARLHIGANEDEVIYSSLKPMPLNAIFI